MKIKKDSFAYKLLDLLSTVVISFIVVFLISHFIVSSVQVVGSSMYPTLVPDQFGIASRFKTNMNMINRFDVVVIKNKDYLLVKRIVGMPNEVIEYKNDVLYVNDEIVEENFFDEEYKSNYEIFTKDFGPIYLGEDEYFCLGDNRVNSKDSREYGSFKKSELYGIIDIMIWPFKVVN